MKSLCKGLAALGGAMAIASHPALAQTVTASELRPIKPYIPQPFWQTPWPYLLIGAVALALMGWYGIKKMKPAHAQDDGPTPYETALEQLKLARKLIEEKEDRALSFTLSNALRNYIEQRFDIRAPEQTTEEFLVAAAQHPYLKGAVLDQLSQFLDLCDRVKFAKASFGSLQRQEHYDCAEQFLRTSENAFSGRENPGSTTERQRKLK